MNISRTLNELSQRFLKKGWKKLSNDEKFHKLAALAYEKKNENLLNNLRQIKELGVYELSEKTLMDFEDSIAILK